MQLQSAIARLMRSQRPEKLAALREASGTDLNTANGWCVGQVHLRERLDRDSSLRAIAQPGAGARRGPVAGVLRPATPATSAAPRIGSR